MLVFFKERNVLLASEMTHEHNTKSNLIEIPLNNLRLRLLVPNTGEDTGSRISFWWGITTAAINLARYLECQGDLMGKRVIDLGCGLGKAGIAAGLLGARVVFTDYKAQALKFAKQNCRLNGLDEKNIEFQMLDWEYPYDLPRFSTIIGSEILYDYYFHSSLISLFDSILEPGGSIVLSDRKRLVVTRFIGRLIGRGFHCSETTLRVNVPAFPDQEISIFTLKR
jgi:predicted nicotinamide N-methyase